MGVVGLARRLLVGGVLVALLGLVGPAGAQNGPGNPCGPDATAADCLCEQETPPAVHLPAVQAGAADVRAALCADNEDLRGVLERLTTFLRETQGWAERYGGFRRLTEAGERGERVSPNQAVLDVIDAGRGVPTVTVGRDGELVIDGRVFLQPANVGACDARAMEVADRADCFDVLDEYAELYNHAQATYASDSALAFARYARDLDAQWQAYLDDARSQTLLELTLNSYLYRRDEDARFAPPPERQWILLHPNLVMEYVEGAEDGDQFQEALMLEVVGVNYWRQERWYLPSGGSLIALYSDRREVEDWGYGAALHFANAYTVGVSRRDDETGFFLTVDLLKLVENRRTILESFGR
ncbi:hypothetical protein [Sediminicurvatus halobius]|uniref:Uncharacterized protein n=1 Tax=Sediminicurvatus halobius TaxID=2182432 RepID=A0A2U2MX57_9GAMM|nr:hypothetical protein [Spiribacter halobius]PWG61448.1 hypothetical protein DEM34_16245 [Spiribacter halobius]UEX77233.1 hypothetical protein LMH63_14965 [Spiribacter halobius]